MAHARQTALVREYKPLFQQFVSGRNNVTANDLVTKLGYKNTKINFALTKILNRIKDEYQESRSRKRGNISEGVGGDRTNRVRGRVLQESIPQQDRGGDEGVRGRGGFVLEPIVKDVAQRGLREMVGEKVYSDFLMRALRDADEVDRRAIVNTAMRNGLNFLEATDNHLARLAEQENIDEAYLGRVKNLFTQMLADAGMLAVLGVHSQHTKDKGTHNAINNFVNAISSVNAFIATLTQKQICFYELEQFINSIPLADEETE